MCMSSTRNDSCSQGLSYANGHNSISGPFENEKKTADTLSILMCIIGRPGCLNETPSLVYRQRACYTKQQKNELRHSKMCTLPTLQGVTAGDIDKSQTHQVFLTIKARSEYPVDSPTVGGSNERSRDLSFVAFDSYCVIVATTQSVNMLPLPGENSRTSTWATAGFLAVQKFCLAAPTYNYIDNAHWCEQPEEAGGQRLN